MKKETTKATAKAVYYIMSAITSATMLHIILIQNWHAWEATIANTIPIGQITGWTEVAIFATIATTSAYYATKQAKQIKTIYWTQQPTGSF